MKKVYALPPHIVVLLLQFLLNTNCTDFDVGVQVNLCNATLHNNKDIETKCTCDFVFVDCNHLGLKELPNMITFPRNTFTATFRGNEIEEINPDTFYNGKDVVQLDLSHNRITHISPEAFAGFKNLQKLILSRNRLWNLPWKAFISAPSLKHLDLSFNHISRPPLEAFNGLDSLEELILNSNPIYELEPLHFKPLPNLLNLYLDSIVINEVADRQFVYTPKLKMLTMAHNLLEEIPTEALRPLKNLKNLDLSGNPIKTISKQAFKDLDNLLVLHMDRMPVLESINAYALGELKNLVEFHCSYNYMLYKIDKDAFVNISDGRRISPDLMFLRQNNIYMLPPTLMTWKRDLDLDLGGNPWDCHCQTQWLIRLKTKNKFQDRLFCETPPDLRGRSLDSLKDTELPCGMSLTDIVTIAIATLLAVALFCTLMGFLWHRKSIITKTKNYAEVYRSCTVDEDIIYEKKYIT